MTDISGNSYVWYRKYTLPSQEQHYAKERMGKIREAETEAVTEVLQPPDSRNEWPVGRPSPPRFNLDEGAEELLVQTENSAHEREGDLQVASAVQDRFRQPEGRAACFRSLGVDQDVWEQQIPM
ncbi:hypothetical protein C8J57DRAFT_1220341 [Mycena rebaudengoi]|nr:hypothetical protein C8J57DRAFT_1220341 [Mycena rebaudengoi]